MIADLVRAIASGGELPPITSEMIDEMNAQHAREFADCDRAETLGLLRQGGASASALVRGLSDEQLDRSAPAPGFGGQQFSAQMLIEGGLIGHAQGHGASIRATVGG